MGHKNQLPFYLFIYIVLTGAIVWALYIDNPHASSNLFALFGHGAFSIFLLGFIGITLYCILENAGNIIRWGVMLVSCGALLLALGALPGLIDIYLLILATAPFLTLGCTALFLGFAILLFPIIEHVGPRRSEE